MSEQKKYSSVIDVPKKAADKDAFGIERYTKGLIEFIENTATPITVALQGEWGSGKTSLMNTLKKELCDDEGKKFIPVWLNTWQYSLMKDANETLVSIIKGLTEEVISKTSKKNSEAVKKLSRIFGKVLKASAKMVINTTTGQDAGEIFDALSPENREVTVLQLRNELNKTIKGILEEKVKDGFIFFIDDLDRIDPPVAVEILELLKNIFDLEKCVFVLAIDYDVVIKGLEPKFGKFSEKNEREFRSFFDKIIQLPFSMPVASYNIDNFLIEKLKNIEYLDESEAKSDEIKRNLSEITVLSVGSNPRAIKRLLNSLSLINKINSNLKDENVEEGNKMLEKIINFALVNIQIAYPQFYNLLVKYPNFVEWDEKIALQMNLPLLDEYTIEKLNKQVEFDEEWEKVVFRICEKDFYLKKKALNISRLLNKIKLIIEAKKESIEDVIDAVISLSSVTSLEAFDKPVINYHRGHLLKHNRWQVINYIKEKLPDVRINIQGNRVQTNAYFTIEKNDWGTMWKLHTWFDKNNGKVILLIYTYTQLGWSFKEFEKNLKEAGLFEEYNNIISDYKELIQNKENFDSGNIEVVVPKNADFYEVKFHIYQKFNDVDSFYKPENNNELGEVISEVFVLMDKIHKLDNNVKDFHKDNYEKWKNH